MQTSVLHSYFQLGGERLRDALLSIDQFINQRITHVPLATEHTIPTVVDGELHGQTLVRSHRIPSYHYQDPDNLKLTLCYVSGSSGKVEYVNTRLNRHQGNRQFAARQSDIPWSTTGFLEYFRNKYDWQQLEFNDLYYRYKGLNAANQPVGSVRMVLNPESAVNQPFFEAQQVCLRGLRAISTRVRIEQAQAVEIGRVNMRNTTEEQVATAVSDVAHALAESPVTAYVGGLVLKHKTL